MYGRCGQELTRSAEGYSTIEQPNRVSLDLTESTEGSNCYVVTANSGPITIKVEGASGIRYIGYNVYPIKLHVSAQKQSPQSIYQNLSLYVTIAKLVAFATHISKI